MGNWTVTRMRKASTSTKRSDPLEQALSGIPKSFRSRILSSYLSIKKAFQENQSETCGLRAGKFCEVLLRFLQQHLTGTHTPFGSKISNFEAECQRLEQSPKTAGPESLRLILPRALVLLYTLRNKRGIGHIGGDVEANEIDAATITRVADWCVCELIRIFHALPLEEAQSLLDAVAARRVSLVWAVAGRKRILRTGLDYSTQTLLLLYANTSQAVAADDLVAWVEHSNAAVYRRDVLRRLHRLRLLEYDQDLGMVMLSPTGAAKVEDEMLPKLGASNEALHLTVRCAARVNRSVRRPRTTTETGDSQVVVNEWLA